MAIPHLSALFFQLRDFACGGSVEANRLPAVRAGANELWMIREERRAVRAPAGRNMVRSR